MSNETRPAPPSRGLGRAVSLALLCLLAANTAWGGAFIFAGETNGIDLVTHPTGYTGGGGALAVTVCIDPSSVNAADMEIPVRNIVHTWNERAPTTGNLLLGGNNDIPANTVDFESVALHELGHCIGLAHVNLASESGLNDPQANGTKSTDGANNSFESNAGDDFIYGSSDDPRGDDVNLHWFRKSNNNPFTIAATVDSSTYSRLLADLPGGHAFAANADRLVSNLLGVPNSESVMQQGSFLDEDQRRLVHDDVATLQYAMSGIDETAATSDDYVVNLSYGGLNSNCEVVLDFDNAQAGFAACQTSGAFIGATDHVRITAADVFFNTGFNWHFNTTLTAPTSVLFEEAESGSGSGTGVSTSAALSGVDDHLYVASISTVPDVGVSSVTGLGLAWSEAASHCSADGGTGVSLWVASGSPTGDGSVLANLDSSVSNAVIVVTRYSGAAGTPSSVVVGNANGVAGACTGGPNTSSYAFNVSTVGPNARVLGAVAIRNRSHTPGSGFSERAEVDAGNGVSAAGVAVEDRSVAAPSTTSVAGSLNTRVDWAFAGLAIETPVCSSDGECDDGLFCNGAETCVVGTCQAGTPVVCDDTVPCTDDACNESSDSCDFVANDGNCTDGLFCNGAETCDAALDCQAGTPPPIDDGVACTDDSCDEFGDVIVNTANAANCDDLDECTADSCDQLLGCFNDPIPACNAVPVPATSNGGQALLVAMLLMAGALLVTARRENGAA